MSREYRRFDVIFRDPQATYRPGDVVTGNVILELGQELKLKGIRMTLHGVARCNWDEKKSYTKGSSTTLSHKMADVPLDETVYIMTATTGSLKPGNYTYPFTVRLPSYLPASFEGTYGNVQYWAKGIIERSWKGDLVITKTFSLKGELDLNTESGCRDPASQIVQRQVGCACTRSGPVTVTLTLDRRGFVPGDTISFVAKINNESRKRLKAIRIALYQQVIFKADNQTRRTHQMIKAVGHKDISPGEDIEWKGEMKQLPPLAPSRLGGGCRLIDVKYHLSLIASPKGLGKNLSVPVDVLIGTIPLRKMDGTTPMMTVKAAARKSLAQENLLSVK